MHFHHPVEDVEFEIPDIWLKEASADGYEKAAEAFVAFSDTQWPTVLVPIGEVIAPRRDPNRGRLSLITFFGCTKKVIGGRGRTPRFWPFSEHRAQ